MAEINEHISQIPQGIVVEKDKREEEFENYLQKWLNNEIDYDTLVDHLPDKYKSVWERVINLFFSKKEKL